jgi:hypothetical protein
MTAAQIGGWFSIALIAIPVIAMLVWWASESEDDDDGRRG